jgi:hypothetical protein
MYAGVQTKNIPTPTITLKVSFLPSHGVIMYKQKLTTIANILFAIPLFSLVGTAQAVSLSLIGTSPISIIGYDALPRTTTGTYSTGSSGTVVANQASLITFSYLGSASNYKNSFSFVGNTLTKSNLIGDTTTAETVNAGALDFSFSDDQGGSFANGATLTPTLGFAILDGNLSPESGPNFGPFDYVLGFNDRSASDADYDDFVVGVNISAVPLPASLPLMALSLILFTAVASRRRL